MADRRFGFPSQVKRHAEFTGLKRQIVLYMEELDEVPETSFEKDVVCEDEDAFCLSRENITSLKLLICQVRRTTSPVFERMVDCVSTAR